MGIVVVSWSNPHPPVVVDALLDEVDRARLATVPDERLAAQLATGRALLRLVAADALSCDPSKIEIDRTCTTCGEPHGKPRILGDPVHVNVSHSAERVAVAATPGGPLGIDVEHLSSVAFADFDDAALTPAERAAVSALPPQQRPRARARLWTRKEAALKASGVGLRSDPRVTEPDAALQLIDLDFGPDYAAAVAIEATAPPHITITDASDYLVHRAEQAASSRTATA
jgi:4'-phosphopantetheinyl transferase